MKFTTKLFLTWTSIFLLFYLTVIAILSLFWGIRFQFWQLMLVFFIAGVVPPALLTWLFYKKLDYMESDQNEPPVFNGQKEKIFDYAPRTTNCFDEILQKIDRNFIVSYSDRINHVVKFRTDSRILSWGVCGYAKLLPDNRLQVVVYPMIADSKREEKVLFQILSLLQVVLNP